MLLYAFEGPVAPKEMNGTCRVLCANGDQPFHVCGLPGVVFVNQIPAPLFPVDEDYYCLMHFRCMFCCAECGEIKESDESDRCRRCDWEISTTIWPEGGDDA
jgi:hypothetical protein